MSMAPRFPWTWDFCSDSLILSDDEQTAFASYSREITRHSLNYRKKPTTTKANFKKTVEKRILANALHVTPRHASWSLVQILCASAQHFVLFVAFSGSAHIFQIPLRLAVTLPQFQAVLPFFMLNFVSLLAYQQHCKEFVSSRACFSPESQLRPAHARTLHDAQTRARLEALVTEYRSSDLYELEIRQRLATALAALIQPDFMQPDFMQPDVGRPAGVKRKAECEARREQAEEEPDYESATRARRPEDSKRWKKSWRT